MLCDCMKVFFLRLEESGEEVESGSTATAIFVGEDVMFVSHVGDSCVVSLQFSSLSLCNNREARNILTQCFVVLKI